jgi:hypothetical protein
LQYLIASSTSHHFFAHMSQSNAPKTTQAPVFVEEWHGWWEIDRQKLALQLRLEFASGGKLFGDGHDSHCQFQLGGSYNSNTAVFRTSLTDKRPGRLFQATIERGNVMKGFWEFESAAAASKPPAAKSPFWISRAPADSSTPRDVEGPVPAAASSAATVAAGSLSGSDRLKNYELLEPLGNGVFGVVSKVRRLADNKILVWKELNYGRMNTNERRMMMNEVQILSNTSHAHIVKYFDTILVREKQKMYIVIECAHTPNSTCASWYKLTMWQVLRERRSVADHQPPLAAKKAFVGEIHMAGTEADRKQSHGLPQQAGAHPPPRPQARQHPPYIQL